MRRELIFLTIIVLMVAGSTGVIADKYDRQKALSDSIIKAVVENRLLKEGLHQGKFEVNVDDRIVTLKGKVRSYAEKRRAERATRNVDDVIKVDNKLEVEMADRPDRQIANDIARAVRGFVFYDIFDWVEGDVHNGVVTLKGAVREPWRRSDYERLAENIEGVKEVRNEIRMLPISVYDDQLRNTAARLIYSDPRFARYADRSLPPIHIIVENGKITLKGAVATALERQVIESKIDSQTSAFEITNDLMVDEQIKG